MKEIYWIIIKGIIALILVVPVYRKAIKDRDKRNKNGRFDYKNNKGEIKNDNISSNTIIR